MSDARAGNGRSRGRIVWLQLHRWLGLILFLVLIPLSLSGSLLVWDDWTDGIANPHRYALDASAQPRPLAEQVAAAQAALTPLDRVASVTLPSEPGKPLVVNASRGPAPGAKPREGGPPMRTQVWVDPAGARVLDTVEGNSGLLRVLHNFHGNLMIPEIGRQVVGWLGVAMLISSLTGIWLWLPVTGSIRRGFRWKRAPSLSGRLHHQFGFWIAIPLALVSFTGLYISFPTAARSVESLFAGSTGGRPQTPPGRGALPLAQTRLAPEQVLTSAQSRAEGARLVSLRWPTDKSSEWSVTVDRGGSRADVAVDDESGLAKPPRPQNSAARVMRMLHDGTGYNPVWQTILFLSGLIPALLGITGLLMWLRGRSMKRRVALQAVPAE